MKTLLLSSALLLVSATCSFSQYCGNSGATQCQPSGMLTSPVFGPSEDIACFIKGQSINTTIQIKNFDTITFGGTSYTIIAARIDSIENLPPGLCWSTNKANNTFGNKEDGCIHISGITYALPGQYKLRLIFSFNVGFMLINLINGESLGLKVFLRVIDQTYLFCPPIDTSQIDSNGVIPYNGLYANAAEVSGNLFFDINQNQVFDVGEQPVPNQLVSLGNTYMAITNSSGNYLAYPPSGTLNIKPQLTGSIASFVFAPDSIVFVADSGLSYANNNFGIQAPANYCEGTIAIVTINPPPRPGFNNNVGVHFRNVISAVATSQDISFIYDAHQTFVNANPAPATVDIANRTITWNTGNLNSGSFWQAVVTLNTPQTVAIGTVLNYSTWVSGSSCSQPDIPQSDEESIVVGSYDPNDKAVSPVGEAPGGRILPSTSLLSYTIRFQNTGTYLAENVNVVDTISSLLDLSTLNVQAASHNYEVIIRGKEVTFRFNQINLPDSNSNEPMSHGYIKYSIKPTAGFVQNSVIQNRADIYFDFNSPVRTNTVTSTADNFVGIGKVFSGDLSFEVYPNPLSEGNWQLVTDGKLKGKEAKIYNAEGKLVQSLSIINAKTEIDASRFSKGVYIIRIGNSASRVIKL